MAYSPYSTLSDDYLRLSRDLRREGVPHADMRHAASLETQFSGAGTLNAPPAELSRALRRLEGVDPIARVPVMPAPAGASRITGFLDGSQRTVSAWRIGLIPVIATVTAAAILVRDETGEVRIARDASGESTLRLDHRWMIPRRSGDAAVDRLIARIDAAGGPGSVVDPVAPRATVNGVPDANLYQAYLSDYGRMLESAYRAARTVRERVEETIVDHWPAVDVTGEQWLIADGRRRLDVPRTLGVIKRVNSAHLAGAEAVQVYDLPAGYRTSAFVPTKREQGRAAATESVSEAASGESTPVMWYLRLHDHAGLDTYHGLIRVEAPSDVEHSDEIDQYSSWLLAERTPRATNDARWASLLYPIHLLEGMLKRQIAAETRAWPNAI